MLERLTITRRLLCITILKDQQGSTIQLCHDAGYFEDLINLFYNYVNKSLSSSLSADSLSYYGGTEYPLPSCG